MMILYAWEKCGKRATAKEKFCSECGGEIKVKEKPPIEEAAATLDEVIPQG